MPYSARPQMFVTPFKVAETRVPVGPLLWRALSASLHVMFVIVQAAFDGPLFPARF